MKIEKKVMRTKSQCRQQQFNTSEIKVSSSSTFIKFKPFSQECTLNHIEQKLQSFKNTMTHKKTNSKYNNQETPLIVRLNSIINSHKRDKSKRRRNNLTEVDIRSSNNTHNSEAIQQKISLLKNRSNSLVKIIENRQKETLDVSIRQKQTQQNKIAQNKCRHDLSQQAVDQENAFFDMIHRQTRSSLSESFNKNNCFLFSRSKHKVFAVEQEKPRKIIQIKVKDNRFESFGTYFYGTYMKKYMERRKLLGKKGTLIKMVAK